MKLGPIFSLSFRKNIQPVIPEHITPFQHFQQTQQLLKPIFSSGPSIVCNSHFSSHVFFCFVLSHPKRIM